MKDITKLIWDVFRTHSYIYIVLTTLRISKNRVRWRDHEGTKLMTGDVKKGHMRHVWVALNHPGKIVTFLSAHQQKQTPRGKT